MSDTNDTSPEVVDRGDDFAPTGPDAQSAPKEEAPAAVVEDEAQPTEAKAEEPAKVEDEEEKPRDDKGRFIPKDRFDEAVRKERSEKELLAARLKEFEEKEAQRNVAANFEEANKTVKEMIKQHTSLLADGELEKATDLMVQILEMKEAIAERKAEAKADQAKNAAKEEVRYDALVAKLEADYPQINPDSAEFDTEAVADVQALMQGYIQNQRISPSQALAKAVAKIFPKREDPAPAAEKATELGVRRKEEAVKKAIEAKAKQPASTKTVGMDSDKIGGALDASAIMKMSWDEFVKLPDSKLAEMRGDYVA